MCYKLKLSIIFALDLRNRIKNKQTSDYAFTIRHQ